MKGYRDAFLYCSRSKHVLEKEPDESNDYIIDNAR